MVQNQALVESSRYHTDVGLVDDSSHYGRLALMVGRNKNVLELGCSTGFFSRALTEQFGCTVTGVEIDQSAAEEAKKYCRQVIQGDLDRKELLQSLPDQSFDVVVLSDVLEHLRDPGQLLLSLKRLLKPAGYLVASIPHVGHGSIRLSLLSGQFPYRQMGLLDETHLRFFDRLELENLFSHTGYELAYVHRNRWSILDSEVGSRTGHYPQQLLKAIGSDPEAETYQFIVKAQLRQESVVNSNTSVDFVIFQTPDQPLNDRLSAYLSKLNFSGLSVKFHIVRSPDSSVESYSHLPVEQFDFGSHDFTTFRFTQCGAIDDQPIKRINIKQVTAINKQLLLNTLLGKLAGEFIFVIDTQNLPTTDCLVRLVENAQNNKNAGVIAATPELQTFGSPYLTTGGTISWAPLTCVLLRRSIFDAVSNINSQLSSPAQEVNLCWLLRQQGLETIQVRTAGFFTFGLSNWSNGLDEAKRLYDAIQLRFQWGSWRAAATFVKNIILTSPDLTTWQKAQLLARISLNSAYWIMKYKPIKISDKIGFYGPGGLYCGSANAALSETEL